MRALLRLSVRRPRLVLAGVGLITLLLGSFIPALRLRLDARSLVPRGHPDLAKSDAAARLFALHDVVLIGVAGGQAGVYDSATLDFIDRLSTGLSGLPGVRPSSVISITTTLGLSRRDDRLSVGPLVPPAPTPRRGELGRRAVEALGLADGLLVAADGSATAIVAEIRPEADRYLLLRQVRELIGRSAPAGVSTHLSGTALAQAVLGQAAARDLLRLLPVVLVVLALALTLAFRSPLPALVSLAEIGTSLVWAAGLIGLTRQPVFVTTLVMPVILVSVGVSDDVYVLKHYLASPRRHGSREEHLAATFGEMIRPVSMTAISTVVGLLSLAATGLEPLRIFGVFGAVAILCSTLFTFSLVPALLALFGPRVSTGEGVAAAPAPPRLGRSLFRLLSVAGPRRLIGLAIVGAAGSALLAARVRVDDSWIRNLPADSEVARGDRAINELLAGTTRLELLVDSHRAQGLLQPELLLALLALDERLGTLAWVGATDGIHHDVVRLNAALRGMGYDAYRDALRRGALHITSGEIAQALMLLPVARRAPLSTAIDDELRRARVTVLIRWADYERIAGTLRAVRSAQRSLLRAGEDITPFGDGWISYTTVRLLVNGQQRAILLALATDLVLLALLLRSLRLALIAIAPVALSVLVLFAGLAATGTPLGIANSLFTGIAIGIGLDFAIHLTAVLKDEEARQVSRRDAVRNALTKTAPAILSSAAAITAGFSVLTLSRIMPNVQLGLMICASLMVCAAATLVLVPSLAMSGRGAGRPAPQPPVPP